MTAIPRKYLMAAFYVAMALALGGPLLTTFDGSVEEAGLYITLAGSIFALAALLTMVRQNNAQQCLEEDVPVE